MKLPEHVDKLRDLIEIAFDKRFAQLGISKNKQLDIDKLPEEFKPKRLRFEEMLVNHIGETGDYQHAREKLMDELTFTLFNRLAAVKVMEAASLFPPILTKKSEHGDRSFGHKAWLELKPHMRSEELEGIREYIKHAFDELGKTLPLYSKNYQYALLPDAISLNNIIDSFNSIEKDPQVGSDIWKSDDVLGWLYESYNNKKKQAHKDSGDKTEYNKVSLQSQVYTPRWVVQFLVENSLGKLYLEMYPDSGIKRCFKIANAPATQARRPKPLSEIKIIDPACGSGNFLLYSFDFFYELYIDQIENYGAEYDIKDIPKLIIENNLHGIDLDDRAVQLAQLGLFIKARKKNRNIGVLSFNVVSSDFFLPDYNTVKDIFESKNNLNDIKLDDAQKELIKEVWGDLRYAYKFGSLIKLDGKINEQMQQNPVNVGGQLDLLEDWKKNQHTVFAENFFKNLKTAVMQNAQAQGNTFLSSKTRDAITFLELLSAEYDIATANPPYTDSSDFGPELKGFIESNYKKPYKFHTNLYATFIKRCYDFVGSCGFVAMVHPPTFMYIKTFEDVRKFILEKTHINLFVEWGYLGMFNPSARVDSALYILEKEKKHEEYSVFIKLNHLYETRRYNALFEAYENYLAGSSHELLYIVPQSKLKIIKSWPFIYWISDEFREKFGGSLMGDYFNINEGLKTANNIRYMKFHWEINSSPFNYTPIFKGGPYKKWLGNLWLSLSLDKDRENIKSEASHSFSGECNYYKLGIVCPSVGTKGASFRINFDAIFSNADLGIYTKTEKISIYATLAFLNSKLVKNITDTLNPTVNITVGDIKRIPYKLISPEDTEFLEMFSKTCIKIEKNILSYSLIEYNYSLSPFYKQNIIEWKNILKSFFYYENYLRSQILIIEAIINEKIFEIYNLTENDKAMILAKEGDSIGGLPVLPVAREIFLAESEVNREFPLENIKYYINSLPLREFSDEERDSIESEFSSLYQSNNDFEEFCIRHNVNPINVWYWFKQSNIIPEQRMHTLAMEFLVDIIREILNEDDDGIVPLVPNAGEKVLLERIEEKFREKGFSPAQYSSFDSVLGRPIHEYINRYFFAEFSDHLNLFMYLPKTPFIWHLSSGPEQGFDCYIIIYKWSRDKLMRIRSVYIEHRERSLINRQSDLAGNESAEAQNEKDRIFRQLKEIESFKTKIDELLAEGYNPVLDDGVGKNIAPLQKNKMIPYEVLNDSQLEKYLNADW